MSDNTSAKGLAREIAQTLKEEPKGKTSPFDTNATVKRIEGGTAWVSIPGGVDETPVQLTVNAKEGDSVQVRVAGGKAWITGNGTAPPTDDQKANEANENAIYAQTIAENAEGSARRASLAAEVAEAKAQAASDSADEAWEKAADAETAAGQAQTSARTANTAANGALTGLSTVQDVIGMLNWAAENASYSLTQDTDIVPGKTYWTRSGSGTEADPYVWTPVTNPVKSALSTYYEITGVEEAMGDFINAHLALTEEGLWILPDGMDTASYRVLIATGGQGHVYKDAGTYIIDAAGNTVAKLGEVITLGVDDSTTTGYCQIDKHSFKLYGTNTDETPYVWFSDLRDDEGYSSWIETFYGDGEDTTFKIRHRSPIILSVTIDGVAQEMDVDYTYFGTIFTFTTAPSYGAEIVITYKAKARQVAFTIGARLSSGTIGDFSVAEGEDVVASGSYSHAEGKGTSASGSYSHAEGEGTTASGIYSHAEGRNARAEGAASHAEGQGHAIEAYSHAEGSGTAYSKYSHAEGYASANGECAHAEGRSSASLECAHAEGKSTVANGIASHAEGYETRAYNNYTHTQNVGTWVEHEAQTALGTYNSPDTTPSTPVHPSGQSYYGINAVIIGNGTDDNNRSNALTVDWSGNVWTAGTVTENNGTRDIDLTISEATIQKYVNLGMSLT